MIDFIWSDKWYFSGSSCFITGKNFHRHELFQLFHVSSLYRDYTNIKTTNCDVFLALYGKKINTN